MSAREWKPGDVAMVDSWRGEGQIAFRCVRVADQPQWCVLDEIDTRGLTDEEVFNARPVVVIDPEDRTQVERLRDALGRPTSPQGFGWQWTQAALRSLVAPPKPEEPVGRYAVVEDSDAVEWVRAELVGAAQWHSINRELSRWSEWDDIDAVKVLSEGVSDQ